MKPDAYPTTKYRASSAAQPKKTISILANNFPKHATNADMDFSHFI